MHYKYLQIISEQVASCCIHFMHLEAPESAVYLSGLGSEAPDSPAVLIQPHCFHCFHCLVDLCKAFPGILVWCLVRLILVILVILAYFLPVGQVNYNVSQISQANVAHHPKVLCHQRCHVSHVSFRMFTQFAHK